VHLIGKWIKIAQSSASCITFLTKYFPHNQSKENEVGEVRDANGGFKLLRTGAGWGNLKAMERFKELSVDGSVIL
jgi:hypothetical protein